MQQNRSRSFLVEPGFKIGIFAASIFVLLFYVLLYVARFDPYTFTVGGAIFELIALPVLASLVILPVFAILQIFKNEKGFPVLPLLSFLAIAAAILILVLHPTV